MRRIITYGTFDLFHQGHFNILKRAKEQGDYLIVGVSSESYDIERGKLNVRDDLITRIRNVEATGLADMIISEEYQGQKVNDIIKYQVDALVLGSDWTGKFDYLREYCEVIYLERTKDISSTQLRNESMRNLRIAIVTDDADDNGLIDEAHYVSGLHITGVCSPELPVAESLRAKYDLAFATDDYGVALKNADLVYIKTGLTSRLKYAESAVAAGVAVICEPPISLDPNQIRQLQMRAEQKHVPVIERVTIAYLRAFTQLVWYLRCGIIGDVIAFKTSLDLDMVRLEPLEAKLVNLFALRKILGWRDRPLLKQAFVAKRNGVSYSSATFERGGSLATFEIIGGMTMDSGLTLIGSQGWLDVPGDWLRVGYFQVHSFETQQSPKHFSFNFEGNGFRYILQEFMIMNSDGRTHSTRYLSDDSIAVVDLINMLDRAAGA